MDDDHEGIEEGRRRAAGPLGRKLGEFPMLFARAVFFGQPPSKRADSKINNGTATLLALDHPIAVTCSHVLSEYRQLHESDHRVFFKIGNLRLDPIEQLLAEDVSLDLATIRLEPKQIEQLKGDGIDGSGVFQPVSWPPPAAQRNEYLALAGFPGTWRKRTAHDEIHFHGYSIGATAVSSISEERIACQFERDKWVWNFRSEGFDDPKESCGMSGGPAFVLRGLHYDFAGIIYEFSSEYDIMFLRPAHLIRADGTIGGMF